ncbi:MAG: FimV/HubP family polar landmark protein [Sulfuricellaceae bacterium]|nr:FimV/HubP family polar landmark protein [Sulfuricellaceae bacterium]
MVGTFKLKPWVIAGLLALSPAVANSAGLGKLTVLSALGQPLRAEIELHSVQANELDSIVAKVASVEAFRSAGVERSSVMSDIRFSVEQKKDGSQVLKMSTVQAVNDPFLDVLIELNWSSGRLLREYTALMDPVGFAEPQAVHPVEVPVQKSLAASKSTVKPVPSEVPQDATPVPASEPEPKAVKKTVKPAEPVIQAVSGGESYGVKSGDTLSSIARNTKPEGYSLEQMLVALYQSNKDAFSGGNMNRLSTGKILRIPKEGEIAAVSQADATREIKAQTTDWNAYRNKLATTVAEAPKPKEESAKQAASGKITTAVQDKAAPAPEPSKDVLKVTKGEAPAPGKDVQALQGRLQSMQEDATAREKTIKEANDRISTLEKSVKEMQQLVELKNKNLADLQKQAAAKVEPAKPAKPEPVKPAPAKPEAAKPVPPPEPVKPVAAPVKAAEPVAEKPVEAKPETVAPVEVKPVVKKKPIAAPAPEPVAEPDFIEGILNEPLYLAGGAGALLLAGGALVAISRRRRKSLSSFEDSILTGGDLKANTVFGETAGGVVDTGDTSFLTDFSQAGLGSIDTNDVDPIAEAEVYMAYGRDAQAEEILKEAQAKDPSRHEIHLKLLEIYAARKNLIAFETLAGELYASVGGQGVLWDKAAEMGRSLDPMNPLYAAREGAVSSSAEDDAFGLPDSGTDMTAPTQGFEEAVPEEAEDFGSDDAESDLDFDVESLEEEAHPAPVETESENETLEFDMGALTSAPSTEAETEAAVTEHVAEEEGEALEFDMGSLMPAVEPIPAAEAVAAVSVDESIDDVGSMEFDLDTLIEPQAVMAPDEIGSDQTVVDQDMEFSLDFPEMSQAAPEGAVAPATDTEIPSVELDFGGSAEAEAEGLDFNFEVDTLEVPASEVSFAEPAEDTVSMPALDLSGIDLELNEASEASPEASSLDSPALPELAAYEGDEAQTATKLDLARAYVEMGDKDGAKEILEEVLKEGNAQQQADANQLLASF